MALDVGPLRRAGIQIDEEEFARLVAEALPRVVPTGPSADARADLTEAEATFLREAGVDLTDLSPEDRGGSSALTRTAAEYAALVASALTVAEAATLLRVDESAVRQRLSRHTLFGIRDARGWRLPRFQFAQHGLVPGLAALAPTWQDVHSVEVARWFCEPHVDLELGDRSVSPRDWLLTGQPVETVVSLAEELHTLG